MVVPLMGKETELFYAKESSYGTAVLATRRLRATRLELKKTADKLIDQGAAGRRGPTEVFSGLAKIGPGILEWPVTFENADLISLIIGAAPSTTGAGPYVHTYEFAAPSKSLTLVERLKEVGGTNERLEYAGVAPVSLTLRMNVGEEMMAELEVIAKALDASSSTNTDAALTSIHKETISALTGGANNADNATELPMRPGTLTIDAADAQSGSETKLALDSTPATDSEFCENADGTFDIFQPAADTDVIINYEVDANRVICLDTNTDVYLADLANVFVAGDKLSALGVEIAFNLGLSAEDYTTEGLLYPAENDFVSITITIRLARATQAQASAWRTWQNNSTDLAFRYLLDNTADNRSIDWRFGKVVLMELNGIDEHDGVGLKQPELILRALPAVGENPDWTDLQTELRYIVENYIPGAFAV